MRQSLLRGALLCLLLASVAAGCVVPSSSTPPRSQVVEADARALAYGRSAAEIFQNPQLRDKLTALFGADWNPPTPGGVGKLTGAAPEYFGLGGPVRMVTVGDANYISVTGCVRTACDKRRGLLLISEGGEQLMARLDDGGFLHHYAFGSGLAPTAAIPVTDSALRALTRLSDGDPYPRPAP
jgi:hypothetical protein